MPPSSGGSAISRIRNNLDAIYRDPGLRREANAMGIYVSIVLIAALIVGDDHGEQSQTVVLEIVWGTTVGLALAHYFAISVAERLENEPPPHSHALLLFAHVAMAIAVAVVATIAVVIAPSQYERLAARWAAALFIGAIVFYQSRAGGASWRRSLLFGGIALVLAGLVAYVKWFIGH